MQITLAIKCPTCLSDSIKKNGIKVDGKQNYQCKDCKRQFIGDHALSYLGCKSGITRKILQLMVRGSGIRDIAEVERISIGKVLRTLTESTYEIQPQQIQKSPIKSGIKTLNRCTIAEVCFNSKKPHQIGD